jgi:hypothetical protein
LIAQRRTQHKKLRSWLRLIGNDRHTTSFTKIVCWAGLISCEICRFLRVKLVV